MGFIIAALIGAFIFWFIWWARKRGAYYNMAERELQRMKVDSSLVDKKYGRGKYHASLEFMRKHGLSPQEAAKAIAADLSGEYNEFLEKLNAEGSNPGWADPARSGETPQHDLLTEKIKSAYSQSAQLAETLAERPMPNGKDIQSAREFGALIASFVASLANTGVQIEDGSTGKTLAVAMERRDFDAVSEIQATVMQKVRQLSGEDRSEYVFQMFWPKIYKGLSARH